MRKVIFEEEKTKTIHIKNIDNNSIVGIQWKSGLKGIIIENSNYKKFSVFNNENNINRLGNSEYDSIQSYIDYWKIRGIVNLFVFESVNDCLKWMID